jgi:hypothetical protein
LFPGPEAAGAGQAEFSQYLLNWRKRMRT